MHRERYVYDVLYGRMHFPDYVWKTLSCPELQRLREVRMCNINSLCLTGGSNINRYEHSLGTAHLALQCLDAWPWGIDEHQCQRIVLAAMLHDVGSSAFGHSVQYVLTARGFEHESLYDILKPGDTKTEHFQYRHARTEPIYFGMPRRLAASLPDADLIAISEMVAGRGDYGPLINGSIDLDNIDNVYRLAYHIGLTRSTHTPCRLAQALHVYEGHLLVEDSAMDMLEEWYEVRRCLYRYLLLNPDEFSAKCMLEEALELAQARSSHSFSWSDVDYQLLAKLAMSSDAVSLIIARLMIGDLYGCVGIYATDCLAIYDRLQSVAARQALEQHLSRSVRALKPTALKSITIALHIIKDVNKTQREIVVHSSGGQTIRIGAPSRRILLGVFMKNSHLSMTEVTRGSLQDWGVTRVILDSLRMALDDSNLTELTLYGEADDVST